MASKELEPSLSPTFKVVDGQELGVDIYLPDQNTPVKKEKHSIGEILLALHSETTTSSFWVMYSRRLTQCLRYMLGHGFSDPVGS